MRSFSMTVLCIWLVASLAVLDETALSADDNWPKFRGHRAGVVDDDPALPDGWSERENVVWKLDVPGLGWSSPIAWGDYIFMTSAISATKETTPKPGLDLGEGQGYTLGNAKDPTSSVRRQWMLYAVDFNSGKIRWKRQLRSAVPLEAKQLKTQLCIGNARD